MKSDQSVPLSEALERFSDPGDWQEFQSLGYCEYQMFFFLDGPFTEDDRRQFRAHKLKEQLEAEFLAKLTAGSLQASGIDLADRAERQPSDHPGGTVATLTPDFKTSEATGGGSASSIFGCRSHQLAAAQLRPPGWRSRGRITRSPGSGPSFGAGCSTRPGRADRAGRRTLLHRCPR